MAEKLRLAVIGTGLAWDRLHYPALEQLSDKYEITAVCNKTIDKAQGFAQGINLAPDRIYNNYNEMLRRDDIDVVDVLVPISENFEVAKDVLLAGKNLIAEKPFSATLDGANELLELKNRNNLKVMVAENYRYDEGNKIIKDIISRGKIGEITNFTLDTGADFSADMSGDNFAAKEWRQHPNFNGGIFLDGGVHDMALMRFLFGDVKRIYAVGLPQIADHCPFSTINALLTFKNNISGSYTFRSNAKPLYNPPIGLRIFGTFGEIYLESKDCGVVNVRYNNGQSEDLRFTPERGYYNELLNFYDNNFNNENIISTPEKEIGDIELVFNILKSIEKGEIING